MSSLNDTKFCTSCQSTQPLATGEFKQTRGVTRWVCRGCLERKYESIYKNHERRKDDKR
jgi:hypothetical protein